MTGLSRPGRRLGAAAVTLALLSGGCTTGSDAGGDELDPQLTEAYLQRNFAKIPRITEALTRILATFNGDPQPGVTFTTITGGVQGTVGVDLDNNGSYETSVSATVLLNNPQLGIAGGAQLTVTALNAASATGTGQVNVDLVNATTVAFSNGSALLYPTHGPESITISDANLVVSLGGGTPNLSGSAAFAGGGKSGNIFFEPNGSGGFRLRVTSPDFDEFTIP
jgi:hypothetical protein